MTNSEVKDFYQSLPTKRMGAGALFRNAQGEVLLVKPSYKDHWEIPGGIVEQNESPRQALIRELFEELSLKFESQDFRLICVEYMEAGHEKTEALMFIFEYVGLVENLSNALIPIDSREILEIQFVEPSQVADKVDHFLASRIALALNALAKGFCVYSEGAY